MGNAHGAVDEFLSASAKFIYDRRDTLKLGVCGICIGNLTLWFLLGMGVAYMFMLLGCIVALCLDKNKEELGDYWERVNSPDGDFFERVKKGILSRRRYLVYHFKGSVPPPPEAIPFNVDLHTNSVHFCDIGERGSSEDFHTLTTVEATSC